MNWSNVSLIFRREVRDQLRDRRTLFMIFLLPILLYPLMGTSLFQFAQFGRQQPARVLILGRAELPASPALIRAAPVEANQSKPKYLFAEELFREKERAGLLVLSFAEELPSTDGQAASDAEEYARRAIQQGNYEAVVHFPRGFSDKLAQFRKQTAEELQQAKTGPERLEVPEPRIYFSTATDRSLNTYARVLDVLQRWRDALGRETLVALGVPESTSRPFELADEDIAELTGRRGAAVWSKILPCLLLLFALTGAFYPAVDLCAGEKERGTLETLLISPAERAEIVWGKLFTVMLFSMAMSLLNLVSIGFTSQLILSQVRYFGPPPPLAPLWLLLALAPISALFSALCLALASMARSTKEGQYYLMPLLMVTLPLVLLPLAPGFELNIGNSLIPVTGVMLVLRSLLEGNYWQALPYIPLVAGVTLFCCLLAIRWAVDQFNAESVLFRESERLDLGLWLRHMLRDREDTPNVAAALFCGVLILLVQFFITTTLGKRLAQADFAVMALVTQLAAVAAPALLMTVMLVRSPRQTLLLRLPLRGAALPLALFLAVALHPVANALQALVMYLYPLSDAMTQSLQGLTHNQSLGVLLLVVALTPAICEELAFRGFILSGLRRLGHTRQAIALSSLFFALAHTIFQQSILAFIMGLVIGYIAVQTGSLLPGMLFHATHNALGLLSGQLTPEFLERQRGFRWIVDETAGEGPLYRWPVILAGAAFGLAILLWFRRQPHMRTVEEALQEAIERREPQLAGERQ